MARSKEAKLAGRARDLEVLIRAVAAVHIATAYAFKMALKPRSAESRRGSFEVQFRTFSLQEGKEVCV
jgi:hypothetical protein